MPVIDKHGRIYINKDYTRALYYSYSSGRIKFSAENIDIDAAKTDVTWDVTKFSDADLPERQGPHKGACNTEAVCEAIVAWDI